MSQAGPRTDRSARITRPGFETAVTLLQDAPSEEARRRVRAACAAMVVDHAVTPAGRADVLAFIEVAQRCADLETVGWLRWSLDVAKADARVFSPQSLTG